MKKVVVLGAGMVGGAIAADLCTDFEVTVSDINKQRLDELKSLNSIKTMEADLKDKNAVIGAIQNADLVVGAVPGFMGFEILKTVISEGKDIVDISFFSEDASELNSIAKEKNVIAVFDCGVAPGLSNIILGYHNKRMNVEAFECVVGGLPKKRTMPFQYKAPFSPVDVIEEYTRPARFVVNGEIVTLPALSEPELIEIDPAGTLEAFNTDGLRSLLKLSIPNMKEKTLRYPGHIDLMRVFRDSGFFSDDLVEIKGMKIRPIDFTAKLIFPQWKFEPEEEEFTVMQVRILGANEGKSAEHVYHLYDEYHKLTKTSSMARTTGYTCTAAARLILEGAYKKKGIVPPEQVGEDENAFNFILSYLRNKNIQLNYHNGGGKVQAQNQV